MQLIGFDHVVARDIETDDLVRLAVVDLNVEEIVKQTISEHFLTRQQRTVRSTSVEVARRCREAGNVSAFCGCENQVDGVRRRQRSRRRLDRQRSVSRKWGSPNTRTTRGNLKAA